jgi:hypothetical protein
MCLPAPPNRLHAERVLVRNPRAALEGEELEWAPEGEPVAPRKWYQFWR